jgi:aryl-alcohol dehydrogenase
MCVTDEETPMNRSMKRDVLTVPKDVPLDLLGPMACGLSTGAGAVLNTLRPQTGSCPVVYGTGSVGSR